MRTASPSLISRIFRRRRSFPREAEAKEPERLIELGVDHFARDFPNPSRENCPALASLDALIKAKRLPSHDIREHLLMCSECFIHYRTELFRNRVAQETATATAGIVREHRRPPLVPVLVTTVAAVFAVAAIFVMLKRNESARKTENTGSTLIAGSNPAAGNRQPGLAAPTVEQISPRSARQQISEPSVRENSGSSTAENEVAIDLERYNLLRGPGGPEHPAMVLRPTQNALTVKLPADSPKGTYRLSLTDPFGHPVKSTEGISRDGSRLHLNLNLSAVKPARYLLCVARETEVPQCVPAVVEPVRRTR